MKERRNLIKSSILLLVCFLGLNLQMAHSQDNVDDETVKEVCPTESDSSSY
jgi:hypothetical protein